MTKPTQIDYTTLTTAQLGKVFKQHLSNIHDNIYEICCVMMELQRRNELKQEFRQGVLKWFAPIARNELSPSVVFKFDGYDARIKALMGLPLEEQERIANGGKLPVAVIDENGEVKLEDKTFTRMVGREFDLAFTNGALRPFKEQKEILIQREAEKKKARRSKVAVNLRVDEKKEDVIIGQVRVSIKELAELLNQHGFLLTRKIAEKPRYRRAAPATQQHMHA